MQKTMEKIKIKNQKNSRSAHLQPVIDFLISQGNTPLQKGFYYDKGGIGTFEFADPIDSNLLKEKFEFPDSIKVGKDAYYGGGTVWDERKGLKIHWG